MMDILFNLVEFEFDTDDWPSVWKLTTRVLDPNHIRQHSMRGRTCMTAWLTEGEAATIALSLQQAGYSFAFDVNRSGEMVKYEDGMVIA